MIKLSKYNSWIECVDKSVFITDCVNVFFKNIWLNDTDLNFIRKKYRCSAKNANGGLIVSFECTGSAHCSPEDNFDYLIGKTIAGKRCWDKVNSKTNKITSDVILRQLNTVKEIVKNLK